MLLYAGLACALAALGCGLRLLSAARFGRRCVGRVVLLASGEARAQLLDLLVGDVAEDGRGGANLVARGEQPVGGRRRRHKRVGQ
eukprot:3583255-Pyramimonas_sp.AAC.1